MAGKEGEGSTGLSDHPSRTGLKLAEFSIRYPVTIFMLCLCLLVLGAISLTRIPLVLTPDVDFPGVFVDLPYSNATPVQVQESITRPLEESLATIPNVQRMVSSSSANHSRVQLFMGWGTNVDWLRSEVRDKVEQVRSELPDDVERIMVNNFSTTDFPILRGRISSGRDLRGSYDFLDAKIRTPLERIPGVAEAQISGVGRQEVNIYLRLDDIKRFRLDVGQLFRRMDDANLDLSLGRIQDGSTRYGAKVRGSMRSLEQIGNFPVNNQGLRLAEVADIYYGSRPMNSGRRLNGEHAVELQVRKTSEANTVETVRRIMAKLDEFRLDPALEGIDLVVWHNAGEEIIKALRGLLNAGTLGALLAMVILYLFLRRLGATLTIGFAIPFSIIATVGFLYLFGKTLNVLSMMGLMLAAGMLVDNAVVVLESIHQWLEKGYDRVTAASQGTQTVVLAVLAATLTSIIIFVPLVFGRTTAYSIWLGDVGASIMIALICSLFISLTLIPLGVAKLFGTRRSRNSDQTAAPALVDAGKNPTLMKGNGSSAVPEMQAAGWSTSIIDAYLRLMSWPLRHRFLVGLVIVPLVFIGSLMVLIHWVPDNSPEARDLQNLDIRYDFTENYHYAKIERDFVGPIESFLLAHKDPFKIKNVASSYNNNDASTQVSFDKEKLTLEELIRIRREIKDQLPEIPGAEIGLGRQGGAESQTFISANMYGEDNARLQALAQEAKQRLIAKGVFSEVFTDAERGREEAQIVLKRDLARKYGVSPQSVAGVLSIVIRGRKIRGYRTSEGEVEIWLWLRPGDREDLEDLKSVVVGSNPEGQEILLSQVADFRLVKTPTVIRRENRRAYSDIMVNYTGGKQEEGKRVLTEVMDSLDYPKGYGWTFGFWTQRRESEDIDLLFNVLLAFFMVYFVMASLFESLAHPFAIMFSLPFALVGVTWFLFLTGTPFNLMSKIGLMVLVGIVVNNGIVLIDHINNLRRQGLPRSEAILSGCRERFRPILMTATTTIVGLIPLALGTTGMFDLRYFPLARTVMGGLISSTLLTLVVLPTYYTLLDDLAGWFKRTWWLSGPNRSAYASPHSESTEAAAKP